MGRRSTNQYTCSLILVVIALVIASQEKCSATARRLIQDDLPKRNDTDTNAEYVPDFDNYSNWSGFGEDIYSDDLSPQSPEDYDERPEFYLSPEPSDVYYDDSDELSPQPSEDYFGESEYDDSDDLSPRPSEDYFGESEYDGAVDHDSELSSHASDDYYDVSEHGVTDLSPQPAETIAIDNYTLFD